MRSVAVVLAAFASFAASNVGELPDKTLTPGVCDPALTRAKICAKGFRTSKLRDVDEDLKRKVYAAYGVTDCREAAADQKLPTCGDLYEVDHLCPIELGGAEDEKNLWPQRYAGTWNARVKDRLETHLHTLVCHSEVTLAVAQREITGNWIASYKKRISTEP